MHLILLLIFSQAPMIDGVYIGSQGPFRFGLDTGAESTSIDSQLAEKLKLTPQYRVELVTATASSLALALRAQLRAGSIALPDTEALLTPLSGADGILGQSALRRLDYQIDNSSNTVRLDAAVTSQAFALPLIYMGNRIAIPVQIHGRTLIFILDSGANVIVLPEAVRGFHADGFANLQTHNGNATVRYGRIERLTVGGMVFKAPMTAIADVQIGLLPTALFRRITVSNSTATLYLEK